MIYVVKIFLPHPFHGIVQLGGRLLELLQGGVNEGRGVLLLGHVDHDLCPLDGGQHRLVDGHVHLNQGLVNLQHSWNTTSHTHL